MVRHMHPGTHKGKLPERSEAVCLGLLFTISLTNVSVHRISRRPVGAELALPPPSRPGHCHVSCQQQSIHKLYMK